MSVATVTNIRYAGLPKLWGFLATNLDLCNCHWKSEISPTGELYQKSPNTMRLIIIFRGPKKVPWNARYGSFCFFGGRVFAFGGENVGHAVKLKFWTRVLRSLSLLSRWSFSDGQKPHNLVKMFLTDYLSSWEKVVGANFSMEPLNRPRESSKLIYEIISKGPNLPKSWDA